MSRLRAIQSCGPSSAASAAYWLTPEMHEIIGSCSVPSSCANCRAQAA
jgi:hypothetical protein